MTYLTNIDHGKIVTVVDFDGGLGVIGKIRQLGIMPGDEILVQRYAPFGGPIMIEVHGRNIALGRGIASKIQVEEKECASL
jgi:ferrous iron transport protein A